MPTELPAGTMVAIRAEGKQYPLAIGVLKLSTEEIRRVNAGTAIETMHYLNDGLWTTTSV